MYDKYIAEFVERAGGKVKRTNKMYNKYQKRGGGVLDFKKKIKNNLTILEEYFKGDKEELRYKLDTFSLIDFPKSNEDDQIEYLYYLYKIKTICKLYQFINLNEYINKLKSESESISDIHNFYLKLFE